MKKWILIVIVLAAVGGTWWYVRENVRVTLPGEEPKLEKIVRADVRVPITAAGLIEPIQRIEYKPLASGEIIDIKVKSGDYVKVGDELVLIKRDDEERNVARAADVVNRGKAALERARVAALTAKANIISAKSRVDELVQSARRTQFELKKQQGLFEREISSDQDLMLAQTADEANKAQLIAAQAAVENAEYAERDAKEAVKIQELALAEAEKDVKEAELRLVETRVISRHDAVITDVKVEKGMVVQSGRSAFGGTSLLTMAVVSKLVVKTRVDEADYGKVTNVSPLDALPKIPGLREALSKVEGQEAAAEMQRRGGSVVITVDAFPDKKFEGRIELVEPQGKLNTGASVIQFDVQVEITDPSRSLLPLGTQAQVEFTVESEKDVLTVPADAVKQDRGVKGVYIKGASGRDAKPRFVKSRFGITDGSVTHLVGALSEDEADLLKEGVEVYTKLPASRDDEDKK